MMASRTSGRWLNTSTVVVALTSGLLTDGTVVVAGAGTGPAVLGAFPMPNLCVPDRP